jgi:hypothetical protein
MDVTSHSFVLFSSYLIPLKFTDLGTSRACHAIIDRSGAQSQGSISNDYFTETFLVVLSLQHSYLN